MEQRLRTTHRAIQRQVKDGLARRREEERRIKRRKYMGIGVAGALIVVAVALVVVFGYILPGLAPRGIVIDGKFQDWDDVNKRGFQENPAVPDNIDFRQTAMARQDGDIFFFVRTYGTILKGSQNATTKYFKGDWLRVYFDTDRNLSSGLDIEGIGADYQVYFYGWNNDVQEIGYLRYNAGNPQVPWELLSVRSSEHARAVMSRIEVQVEPGQFGLDSLPTDLVVLEMVDSEGNTDTVS